MILKINLGEIWLADLNPRVGSELGKTRPVLIIQDQVLLDANHPSTLIIPLTTNLIDDAFPLRIRIKAHNKFRKRFRSFNRPNTYIDNKRLILGPLATCSPLIMKTILKQY
ncbi:type II toxin-antitoxin system PemK/MazF family toxin [Rickettsia australis]|uniref:Growth inhibitor n=1 Tax=Rickettsia australis (strain Cutlack) TaxID=1105110 RepID=H8K9D7_RICAC|nr:type II toxin-antitoxin system PemK/MazF family toxin [Rickettsia australis]AFC70657.1 growth inhibitor [Rickettsia australis str. Cutlack]